MKSLRKALNDGWITPQASKEYSWDALAEAAPETYWKNQWQETFKGNVIDACLNVLRQAKYGDPHD